MRLINLKCEDSKSFEYSIILYLYYYNIQKNHGRRTQLFSKMNPYLHINFNKKNYPEQFEKDNPQIDLFITDINSNPIFLTHNNALIKITLVKLNEHRCFSIKPSLQHFDSNVAEIKRINRIKEDNCKNHLSLNLDE